MLLKYTFFLLLLRRRRRLRLLGALETNNKFKDGMEH